MTEVQSWDWLLPAALAVIRVRTGGFGLRLRHVLPFLGFAVIPGAGAVVDIGRRIDPDHASTTTGGLRHVAGAGGLRRTSRSGC